MKPRAIAPTATITDANRNADGTTIDSDASVRIQGMRSASVAPPMSRIPSSMVSEIDTRFSMPVTAASVATASTLPVIRSKRSTGEARIVSSVPRSRSPAVMSIAG